MAAQFLGHFAKFFKIASNNINTDVVVEEEEEEEEKGEKKRKMKGPCT